MTVPHMMNCPHDDAGWCLKCVKDMGEACVKLANGVLPLIEEAEDRYGALDETWNGGHQVSLSLTIDEIRSLKAASDWADFLVVSTDTVQGVDQIEPTYEAEVFALEDIVRGVLDRNVTSGAFRLEDFSGSDWIVSVTPQPKD